MTPAELKAWRRRLVLTRRGAGMRLGLSARAIAYYEDGKRTIPRVVELACWAVEHPGPGFPASCET